ncbi:hypothetical protein ACI784_23860 [Geodermatophilus sp. SYSU D01186]
MSSLDEADGIVLANEFAGVRLRVLRRRTGQVLEVYSPRRGSTVVLDATVLDLLAGTPVGTLLALVEDDAPSGPH